MITIIISKLVGQPSSAIFDLFGTLAKEGRNVRRIVQCRAFVVHLKHFSRSMTAAIFFTFKIKMWKKMKPCFKVEPMKIPMIWRAASTFECFVHFECGDLAVGRASFFFWTTETPRSRYQLNYGPLLNYRFADSADWLLLFSDLRRRDTELWVFFFKDECCLLGNEERCVIWKRLKCEGWELIPLIFHPPWESLNVIGST